MSDLMFYGVLRMPYEMAMSDEISRRQFYSRAQEAVSRVEAAEARLAEIDRATPSPSTARPDDVPIPISADMAQLMVGLGLNYLQHHAPERLKQAPSTAPIAEDERAAISGAEGM